MNIVIYHYETSTEENHYDKDVYENVRSVQIDLMTKKQLFFIDKNNQPVNIVFAHPVIIELSKA